MVLFTQEICMYYGKKIRQMRYELFRENCQYCYVENPQIYSRFMAASGRIRQYEYNQCCGSVTFWYGSGLTHLDPALYQQKLFFFLISVLLITF
jgi:hypothetical protein